MVDADVEIAGVIAKGKLLTLATAEALSHDIADFQADTLDCALEAAGLPNAEGRHRGARRRARDESYRDCRRAYSERGCGPWDDRRSTPDRAA
jgi:hypothetical protein